MLHHPIVIRREEQRLVRIRVRGGGACRLRMLLRAGECPLVEARKGPGNCGDSNVTKNLPPFYTLSAQWILP
jgi:hypothetical protein